MIFEFSFFGQLYTMRCKDGAVERSRDLRSDSTYLLAGSPASLNLSLLTYKPEERPPTVALPPELHRTA